MFLIQLPKHGLQCWLLQPNDNLVPVLQRASARQKLHVLGMVLRCDETYERRSPRNVDRWVSASCQLRQLNQFWRIPTLLINTTLYTEKFCYLINLLFVQSIAWFRVQARGGGIPEVKWCWNFSHQIFRLRAWRCHCGLEFMWVFKVNVELLFSKHFYFSKWNNPRQGGRHAAAIHQEGSHDQEPSWQDPWLSSNDQPLPKYAQRSSIW